MVLTFQADLHYDLYHDQPDDDPLQHTRELTVDLSVEHVEHVVENLHPLIESAHPLRDVEVGLEALVQSLVLVVVPEELGSEWRFKLKRSK